MICVQWCVVTVNTFQQLWDDINNQICSKCLESGLYLIVDLIALVFKMPIMYGIDRYHVIATIAIQVFVQYVNIKLFVVHMLHILR